MQDRRSGEQVVRRWRVEKARGRGGNADTREDEKNTNGKTSNSSHALPKTHSTTSGNLRNALRVLETGRDRQGSRHEEEELITSLVSTKGKAGYDG